MTIIRLASERDLPAIVEIYNEAIVNTTATFDTNVVNVEARRPWFNEHDSRHPIVVAECEGGVSGWASLSQWSDRCAYSDTVEMSFYVHSEYRGQGIGRNLGEEIIDIARRKKFHTVLARIAEGSHTSLHLLESFGFRNVGFMQEVGFKFGRRLGVYLYQLMVSNPNFQKEL